MIAATPHRLRPIEITSQSLVYAAERIGTLLTAVALPEALRLVAFALKRHLESPANMIAMPDQVFVAISSFLSAIVFGEIVRHVANGEPIRFLPGARWSSTYIMMIVLLTVVGMIMGFLSDTGTHLALYLGAQGSLDNPSYTTIAMIGWAAFAICIVIAAMVYPLAGGMVLAQPVRETIQQIARHLLVLLAISAIVMSMLLGFRRLWWFAYDAILASAFDSMTGRIAVPEFVRGLLYQVPEIPLDIVFDILPAVAVGLVWRNLRGRSASA